MKDQSNEAQTFDLSEFESKETFVTSVTLYDYHRKWIDKKEKKGHKINISKLFRSMLDQLIANDKN